MAFGDLADFKARLGLDITPIDEGFKKVEAKAGLLDQVFQKVGGKFGKSLSLDGIIGKLTGSFSSRLIGLFAAGSVANGLRNAIAGTIKGAIDEAVGIEKLQKQFAKFGFSASEIQILQDESRRTGDSIQRITEDAKRLKSVLDGGPRGFVILQDDQVRAFAELVRLAERLEGSFKRIAAFYFGGHAQAITRNPALTAAQALAGLVGSGPAGLGTLHGLGVGQSAANFVLGPNNRGGQSGGPFNAFLTPDQISIIEQKIREMAKREEERQGKIQEEAVRLAKERGDIEHQISELGLSNAEKRLKLERTIKELKQGRPEDANDPVLREQRELDIARAQLQLGNLILDTPEKGKLFAPNSDSLLSIGNFLGSATQSQPQIQIQRDTSEIRKDVREMLAEFRKNQFGAAAN